MLLLFVGKITFLVFLVRLNWFLFDKHDSKTFILQKISLLYTVNAVLLNFLLIKESWKNIHSSFNKKYYAVNCL